MNPRGRSNRRGRDAKTDAIEKVIEIDRVSRTVKGGRRIRFRALVVVGDGHGKVGIGVGKANDISRAIAKATAYAHRREKPVTIINDTIPYEINSRFGSANVFLKPAPQGTSVIAGGTVRAVIEAAGIKNIVAKSLGSANKLNIAKATILALSKLDIINKQYAVEEPKPKPTKEVITTNKTTDNKMSSRPHSASSSSHDSFARN